LLSWSATCTAICPSGWASTPADWASTEETWLALWIAEETALDETSTATHHVSKSTTIAALGEDVSVLATSATIISVTRVAVMATTKDGTAASFTVDVNVFTAESTIIFVAIWATLPTDWTDTIVAIFALIVAEKTILLLISTSG